MPLDLVLVLFQALVRHLARWQPQVVGLSLQSPLQVSALVSEDVELALGVPPIAPVTVVAAANDREVHKPVGVLEPRALAVEGPTSGLPLVELQRWVAPEHAFLVDSVNSRNVFLNSTGLVETIGSGRACQQLHWVVTLCQGLQVLLLQVQVASGHAQFAGHLLEQFQEYLFVFSVLDRVQLNSGE